jgi:SAM-dependent methyltransferase
MDHTVSRSTRVFWDCFWRTHSSGQGAFPGGYYPEARNYVVDRLRERLPGQTGRIIDIGAGADLWLAGEIKRDLPTCQLTALDVLGPDEVVPHGPEITYVQSSACETGLPAASFDAAVSTFTIDYLGQNRAGALTEIGRLLRPAGFAVFLLHHKYSFIAPSFRYEAALLTQQKEALDRKLSDTSVWGRGEIAKLAGNPAFTPELRLAIRNCRVDRPLPPGTDLAALVQGELHQVEHTLSLWKEMGSNLFSNESQVRDFFRGCGFSGEVTTILHLNASILGFGIVGAFSPPLPPQPNNS